MLLPQDVLDSFRAIKQLFRFVVVILGEEIPMPLPIRHKPLRPIRHLLSSGAQIRAFGLSKEELLFYKIRGLIIDLGLGQKCLMDRYTNHGSPPCSRQMLDSQFHLLFRTHGFQ